MKVTLLGSGDATAIPVPLCACEYCLASDRRRQPAVLVETDQVTLLFDFGPAIQEQLHQCGVRSIDGAFLTHAHGDHSGGVPRLYQAAKWDANHLATTDDFEPVSPDFDPGYPIYMTETARTHLRDEYDFFPDRLDNRTISPDEDVDIGDVTIGAMAVEHHRPTFDTLGFLVTADGATVGYAPDMRRIATAPPDTVVDLLICEGAAVLGQPVHGPRKELIETIELIDPRRTVLVNVNEHLQRAHTDELRRIAADKGYELGDDFDTFEIGNA